MAERSIILNLYEEMDDVTISGGAALSGNEVLLVVWRDDVPISQVMSELRRAELLAVQRLRR